MANRTRIRRSEVQCVEVTRRTHYGPTRDWDAVAAVTQCPNGEGIDATCSLGPHDSGSMRLTWDEVQVLRVALAAVTDGEAGDG